MMYLIIFPLISKSFIVIVFLIRGLIYLPAARVGSAMCWQWHDDVPELWWCSA
jgi:hypothetical protein